jgi:hypothetical protein
MKFISSLDFVVIREPGHSGLEKLDIEGLENEGFSLQATLTFKESNSRSSSWGRFIRDIHLLFTRVCWCLVSENYEYFRCRGFQGVFFRNSNV